MSHSCPNLVSTSFLYNPYIPFFYLKKFFIYYESKTFHIWNFANACVLTGCLCYALSNMYSELNIIIICAQGMLCDEKDLT